MVILQGGPMNAHGFHEADLAIAQEAARSTRTPHDPPRSKAVLGYRATAEVRMVDLGRKQGLRQATVWRWRPFDRVK